MAKVTDQRPATTPVSLGPVKSAVAARTSTAANSTAPKAVAISTAVAGR